MKALIKRSYQAIVNRGLITQNTMKAEFINKLDEELKEVKIEYAVGDQTKYIEELTDLATVCIMQIHHLGYDFEKEFESVVLKNEKRANNGNQ